MKKVFSAAKFAIHVVRAVILITYYQIVGPFVKFKIKPGKEKVIFVSGWMTYDLTFLPIKKKLEKQGVSVYCPDFGLKLGSVEKYTGLLNDYIKENKLSNFSIVGFSLGGLIALDYYNKYKPKIKNMIFVGTPFHGVPKAKLAFFSKSAKQMIPGRKFLKILKIKEAKKFYSIVLSKDKYVPPESHILKGSKKVVLEDIGHFNGEFSDDLADTISKLIFS